MNITDGVVNKRRIRRYHEIIDPEWVPHTVSKDITVGQLGRNLFLTAAQGSQVETLRYLDSIDPSLKFGRDYPQKLNPTINSTSNTAVTLAAQFADRITMQYLIEDMGLNISDIGHLDQNCFLLAVQGGQTGLLRYIDELDPELKNGRDVNEGTALTVAGSFADEETVKLLIEGFGMNVTTSLGFLNRNTFMQAAYYGNNDVLRYLYSVDKDLVNSRDYGLSTALTLAAGGPPNSDYTISNHIETVKILIEEMGMDPSEKGYSDRNALMSAVVESMHELLPYLDSIDPDLKNTRDADNDVPLTLAVWGSSMQTITTLVEDLKVNTSLTGYRDSNAFLLAAYMGRLEVLQYLQHVQFNQQDIQECDFERSNEKRTCCIFNERK